MHLRHFAAGMLIGLASLAAAANCVNLGGRSFCAQPGGQAVLHRGNAYCGAGACVADEFGNLFCSPYPGGGAIRAGGAFYAGPGMCLLGPDGSPRCAARPGGSCQVAADGQIQCDGGTVAVPAVRPPLCQ